MHPAWLRCESSEYPDIPALTRLVRRAPQHLKLRTYFCANPYLPQHFLYLRPLPHGHGSLRPTFFSALTVLGGFNNISKSVISSGLSGSSPIVYSQPFFSNIDATSSNLFFVCTLTTAGLFSVPNFAVFLPENLFSMFSPLNSV